MVIVTLSVTNRNPETIANKLASRLGREPTIAELREEVERILTESMVERAGKGRLRMQRKR